jgi:hypothetical protein
MNDTEQQVKLNPSGFLDSIFEVEIKVIDVTKMIPQGAPATNEEKIV